MDNLSQNDRSYCMSRIRAKNTTPEIKVRKLLHYLGYRFRLHKKELPGTPDIVLPRYQTAIFVNGCFWHQHPGCPRSTRPMSNKEYWEPKLQSVSARDRENIQELQSKGWTVLVIWECETKNQEILIQKISKLLAR